MRFGVTENLYGPEELEAFRKSRPAANLARTVTRLDIASFGHDFASITLEFERVTAGGPARKTRGRQSQAWVRLAEGWRIVQAHVSMLPAVCSRRAGSGGRKLMGILCPTRYSRDTP